VLHINNCRLLSLAALTDPCRHGSSHEQSEARLERLFLYCLTWSLGGLLSEAERPAFDGELRNFASNMPPK